MWPKLRWFILAGALLAIPIGFWQIDRSKPLEYLEARFDRAEARAGDTVNLTLKIRWPRTNCSTELIRTFVSTNHKGEKTLHKTYTENGRHSVILGPPPKSVLINGVATSTRPVVLPSDLPPGETVHSPHTWHRCTFPVQKLGDYLTELWPIFVGPKGADARIMIKP